MNVIERKLPPVAMTGDYAAHPRQPPTIYFEGDEFEALKCDIAKQGILVQITVDQGRILDGCIVYKAGKEVGHNFVAANFKEFVGTMAEARAMSSQPISSAGR